MCKGKDVYHQPNEVHQLHMEKPEHQYHPVYNRQQQPLIYNSTVWLSCALL